MEQKPEPKPIGLPEIAIGAVAGAAPLVAGISAMAGSSEVGSLRQKIIDRIAEKSKGLAEASFAEFAKLKPTSHSGGAKEAEIWNQQAKAYFEKSTAYKTLLETEHKAVIEEYSAALQKLGKPVKADAIIQLMESDNAAASEGFLARTHRVYSMLSGAQKIGIGAVAVGVGVVAAVTFNKFRNRDHETFGEKIQRERNDMKTPFNGLLP